MELLADKLQELARAGKECAAALEAAFPLGRLERMLVAFGYRCEVVKLWLFDREYRRGRA